MSQTNSELAARLEAARRQMGSKGPTKSVLAATPSGRIFKDMAE